MWTILKTRAIYLPISQLLLMPSSPCVGGGFSTTHKPVYILLAHRGHYYNLSFHFLSFFLKKYIVGIMCCISRRIYAYACDRGSYLRRQHIAITLMVIFARRFPSGGWRKRR